MASEEQIRAFLALPLVAYFSHEVAPFLDSLKLQYPQIRWVSPTGIHVTLHFFGVVPLKNVSRISKIVRCGTEGRGEIEVYLEGIGGFPDLLKPRALWIGLRGDTDKLQSLQRELEEGFKGAGFPCVERTFKPHLTVGRIKGKEPAFNLDPRDFSRTPSKKIRELVLYQSHLTSEGARYEVLETFSLTAP